MEIIQRERLISKNVTDEELFKALENLQMYDNQDDIDTIMNLVRERDLFMDKKYYYRSNSNEIGPMDAIDFYERAKKGVITPDTLVWWDGLKDDKLITADNIGWLKFGQETTPENNEEGQEAYQEKTSKNDKWKIRLLSIAIVSVVGFLIFALITILQVNTPTSNNKNAEITQQEESPELIAVRVLDLNETDLIARAKQNGLWGFIDTDGDWLIEPQFDSLENFSEGYCLVEEDDLFGFINANGEMIIKPQYKNADSFSNGLACVKTGQYWGFIDYKGNMIIEPKYDQGSAFFNGIAQVVYQGESILIGKTGSAIFSLGQIWEGVKYQGGFVDIENLEISKDILLCLYFEYVGEELDSYTRLFNIDTNQFLPGNFYGHAMLLIDDVYITLETVDSPARLINKKGIDVTSQYIKRDDIKFILPFHEGLAAVETYDGLWGFINIDGEIVIQPQFEETLWFTNGRAPVIQTDEFGRELWGYIDTSGKIVIEPKYNVMATGETFNDGLALVKEYEYDGNHEWIDDVCYQYIDIDGNVILKLMPDINANTFVNGYARIAKGNDGFINTNGELVIDFKYEDAGDFQFVDTKILENATAIGLTESSQKGTEDHSQSYIEVGENDNHLIDPSLESEQTDNIYSEIDVGMTISDVELIFESKGMFVGMSGIYGNSPNTATYIWKTNEGTWIQIICGVEDHQVSEIAQISEQDATSILESNNNDTLVSSIKGIWYEYGKNVNATWQIEVFGDSAVYSRIEPGKFDEETTYGSIVIINTVAYFYTGENAAFEIEVIDDKTFALNHTVYMRSMD